MRQSTQLFLADSPYPRAILLATWWFRWVIPLVSIFYSFILYLPRCIYYCTVHLSRGALWQISNSYSTISISQSHSCMRWEHTRYIVVEYASRNHKPSIFVVVAMPILILRIWIRRNHYKRWYHASLQAYSDSTHSVQQKCIAHAGCGRWSFWCPKKPHVSCLWILLCLKCVRYSYCLTWTDPHAIHLLSHDCHLIAAVGYWVYNVAYMLPLFRTRPLFTALFDVRFVMPSKLLCILLVVMDIILHDSHTPSICMRLK